MADFPLTDDDFARVVDRVFRTAGIVLHAHKRQMVVSRLSRRLRAGGFASFRAYLDHLDEGTDAAELEAFANALTTNLTSFFREAHHLDHFRDKVAGPKIAAGAPRLRVWSAGCSTGEEPYSIALTLSGLRMPVAPDHRILATDIDTGVLAKAKAGQYDPSRLSAVPPPLRRHFVPDAAGRMRIADEIRRVVTFRRLNLLDPWPVSGPFDAIFCRNVLIYFDAATKAKVIDRFAALLPAGGFLYLGHSESILGSHPGLSGLGRTIYRKA